MEKKQKNNESVTRKLYIRPHQEIIKKKDIPSIINKDKLLSRIKSTCLPDHIKGTCLSPIYTAPYLNQPCRNMITM